MSIPVDTAKLADAMTDFGSAYLISSAPDGGTKVVTVDPRATPEGLDIEGPGRGTAANLAHSDRVTVVFWPPVQHGYSLIVDGIASGDADRIAIRASRAVLHRPARHADGPLPAGDCGQDCKPLE